MCSYKHLSCHFGASVLFAMSALLLLLTVTVLLNSSLQTDVNTNEDEIVMKLRNFLNSFSQKTVEGHASKQIRDTSETAGQLKDRTKTGRESKINRPKLSSLYPCNYLDSAARLCIINSRQLGTTLTIGVVVEGMNTETHPINWYRMYKVRGQSEEKSLNFVKLSKGNLPWNINLGGNNELRISPITETDFGYNFFLATLDESNPGDAQRHLQLMMFRIEPISINLGALYHGEEISINIRSHMELPAQSIQYEWSRIGPNFEPRQNLPSNMKLSQDGSTLIIKEHQNYGDMILTCAVYSNKNFCLGRRNFFLKKKIVPTESPNLTIKTRIKRKRRSLEKFYVHPFSDIRFHFPKHKRNYDQLESTDSILEYETRTIAYDQQPEINQMPLVKDLPETISSTQPISHFSIIDKPKETVLNFYGNTPFPNIFETEPEVGDPNEQPSKSLNGLIKQANSMVESNDDRKEQDNLTAKKIIEEKLTFEDMESMLIVDCNVHADCGVNAFCFHIDRTKKFCKCLPHYKGNGMFCWLI